MGKLSICKCTIQMFTSLSVTCHIILMITLSKTLLYSNVIVLCFKIVEFVNKKCITIPGKVASYFVNIQFFHNRHNTFLFKSYLMVSSGKCHAENFGRIGLIVS